MKLQVVEFIYEPVMVLDANEHVLVARKHHGFGGLSRPVMQRLHHDPFVCADNEWCNNSGEHYLAFTTEQRRRFLEQYHPDDINYVKVEGFVTYGDWDRIIRWFPSETY